MLTSNGSTDKRGFTIIELLIVIAILGILFGLALNAWRGWARRQELVGGVRTIRAALDEARSDARRQSISQTVTWDADSITTTSSNGTVVERELAAGLAITTPTDTIIYTAPFGRAQLPEDNYRIAVISNRFEGRNTREVAIFGVTGKTVVIN